MFCKDLVVNFSVFWTQFEFLNLVRRISLTLGFLITVQGSKNSKLCLNDWKIDNQIFAELIFDIVRLILIKTTFP